VKSQKKIPVITIDGASGTGKGVVTHLIAKKLGWNLLDSGVLYRVLAFAALNEAILLQDEPALTALALRLDIQFITNETGSPPHILLQNKEVTDSIRSEAIGNAASIVGALPQVRKALLDRQRAFRTMPGLVTDGRDMGTVIFPDAALKIFLTASPEVRAMRRFNQLKKMGISIALDDLIEELKVRDKRDSERQVAPLMPAQDAISIDTDSLTITEVVERILEEVEKKVSSL